MPRKEELIKPTKEELIKQLEEIKIKEESEKNEFPKQKTYLMNKLRNFVKIEISDKEVSSIFSDMNEEEINIEFGWFPPRNLSYFFRNDNDDDTLLIARKFYNKYATHHQIRYTDSRDVINKFLYKLSDTQINKNEHNWESRGIIPLFIKTT